MQRLIIAAILTLAFICTGFAVYAAPAKKATSKKESTRTTAVSSGNNTPNPKAEQVPIQINPRYVIENEGAVLDKNTGLVWLRDANNSTLPLPIEGAKQFLQEMNSGKRPNFGYSDWRLPTINEIETLVDKSKFYPALPTGHPFTNVQNHFYWSSSSGKDVIDYIWVVDLASGEMVMDYISSCSYKFLWPVRSSWMPTTAKTSQVMTGGLNEYGQLGDGSVGDREAFLPVNGLENVVKVSAGLEHAVALKADGSVWTWGRNNRGQLGNGSHEDSRVPVSAKDLLKVIDVAAGMYHTVALQSDGTVWTWGRNSYGQLGNGSLEDSNVPVRVNGLSGIVKIAAGMYHTVAVKSDGTVWSWGRNIYGQLGDGTRKDRNSPVKVASMNGAVGVAAGLHHTIVVKSDKTVWAWGWNINGMLGDSSRTDKAEPVQVKGLSDIIDVQAGLHHSLALKSDGTVWAWGGNEYSQLGVKNSDGSTALKVEGLLNIKKISAGMYHSMGVAGDGTLWVWGKDMKNLQPKPSPVRIWDVAGINDVAAGKFYTVILSGGKGNVK